jgi:segregation and condensation protein A
VTAAVGHAQSDATTVSLDRYQLRLPTFEGPLDVLLRLIERDKLAIADVSLVAVADGFLACVEDLDDAPPPLLAEFLAVAGRLVLLKSRSLLPRPPVAMDEPEPSDLARQLAEHRALRDAARAFGELDRLGLGSYPRGAAVRLPVAPTERLARHAPLALANALRRRLSFVTLTRATTAPPIVTLAQMTRRFVDRLQYSTTIEFSAALSARPSREETLAGFLALLVLVRRKLVRASQSELFGRIDVERTVAPAALVSFDLPASDASGAVR